MFLIFLCILKGFEAILITQKVLIGNQLVLFSADNSFLIQEWKQVDDRIRGGSSYSSLELLDSYLSFHGTLDTTVLGGAGFCSQQYVFEPIINASEYSGIYLKVPRQTEPKKVSLNVFMKQPADRGDGRNMSQVSYKVTFSLGEAQTLYFSWVDLEANYRGRPKLDAPAFNPESLASFSVMLQSFFNQQQGNFSILLSEIGLFL
jgi:hypothetical protein